MENLEEKSGKLKVILEKSGNVENVLLRVMCWRLLFDGHQMEHSRMSVHVP